MFTITIITAITIGDCYHHHCCLNKICYYILFSRIESTHSNFTFQPSLPVSISGNVVLSIIYSSGEQFDVADLLTQQYVCLNQSKWRSGVPVTVTQCPHHAWVYCDHLISALLPSHYNMNPEQWQTVNWFMFKNSGGRRLLSGPYYIALQLKDCLLCLWTFMKAWSCLSEVLQHRFCYKNSPCHGFGKARRVVPCVSPFWSS